MDSFSYDVEGFLYQAYSSRKSAITGLIRRGSHGETFPLITPYGSL
jgi:hypothetical protein